VESKPNMAMPPRRWVGYALLAIGLSFLFDTLVFLRTNWSPLKIPMFAENELAIGYVVTVVGLLLLLAPTLNRMLDKFAPDASAKTGPQRPQQSNGIHGQGPSRFSLKSTFAKKAVSWLTVTFGVLVGLLALSISGQRWIPDRSSDPYWYKSLIQTLGICLLGLAFIAGSLVAVRNRRRGGLVFVICAPLVAFSVGYPDAGFLAWEKGDGIFYSPFLRIALGLTLLFFVPFVVPLFAIRNKKRAIYLFLISAALVSPVFVRSQWTASLLPRLAGWSALLVIFGLFWLGTNKWGWSPLAALRPTSRRSRLRTAFTTCIAVVILDIAVTFAMTAWQSSPNGPDCRGRGLFTQPVFPGHTVFTARLARVGHGVHAIGDSKKWAGDWAIGIVQEKFWGLPSAWPRFVLLTNSIFWEGETYLVDGRRDRGFLTRFLPIIEAGPCSRTRPVVDATVDLRILREKRTAMSSRIVGFVQQPESFRPWPSAPIPHTPLAGARIDFTGSSGTTAVTADQDGIYEIAGLPPDDYTLTLELPDTQTATEQEGREKTRERITKAELAPGAVIERDFHVVWNGTIEGTVRDTTGSPVQVWVSLLKPDGTDTIPEVSGFQQADKNGSFRLSRIPRGRYKVMVNSYGPDAEFPYPPMYYPSAEHLNDAKVFEIAGGEHVDHADFVLPRLAQRKTEVQVTWPDGHVADGAWVFVAYENTKGFELSSDAAHVAITDHNGQAGFAVFGKSRIRIYAEETVNDLKGPPYISSRYSVPVEFEADEVPDKLDLVVTQKKLPGEH
jgi:hypothetical protein